MESYKPKKNSEISLYPIELALKKMQDENNRTLNNTIYKTSAVLLSGIGTTFLFQNKYLYNIVENVITFFSWNCTPRVIEFLTFLLGCLIFVLFSSVKVKTYIEDSKRNKELREDTAEYFHKVILNNIIMGLSFAKKAAKILNTNESKKQCCFYTSQSLFYLKTALRDLEQKQIFEAGGRDKYRNFVDEVGWITLYETLNMLNNAFHEIDNIIIILSDETKYNWRDDIFELNELKRQKQMIENMENIIIWNTQLLNVLDCANDSLT